MLNIHVHLVPTSRMHAHLPAHPLYDFTALWFSTALSLLSYLKVGYMLFYSVSRFEKISRNFLDPNIQYFCVESI
jgi:hypothetical protein